MNKKMLQIPKKYFDKLFYMNILFKRISLKKYKSANRRFLIPNFVLLNFFLSNLKLKMYFSFFRKYIQLNLLSKIYFSGPFIFKRLFNFQNVMEGLFKKTNEKYLILNSPYTKSLVNTSKFNKVLYTHTKGGNNMLIADAFFASEDELKLAGNLFKIYSNEVSTIDLSLYFTYAIHLVLLVEIYKLLVVTWFLKIIINFFKKI